MIIIPSRELLLPHHGAWCKCRTKQLPQFVKPRFFDALSPVCNCCNVVTCTSCAGNRAPEVWQVVISGLANGTCANCAEIDGTYLLSQFSQIGATCSWSLSFANNCGGPGSISVQLSTLGTDMNMVVNLDTATFSGVDCRWTGLFAKPVNCLTFDQNLGVGANITGVCDATAATCQVTAA